jgi:hypothetical protein
VVAGCYVGNSNDPVSAGWPAPPFPADASGVATLPMAGWSFGGFGYNGSPALAGWEASLSSNQNAIGPLRAGALRAMPDALPLFEGFLREIAAGGYRVVEGGTYSFRCTSSSTRNCAGLTSGSLSNHAWGLALDMNSAANPEMMYTGVDGASACATPVKTDFPQWVIQTAEKWGLYWGGYGWNDGCASPTDARASARRDSTHFEFRGTPAQARAIAAHNLGGACISVADANGSVASRCLTPGDAPGRDWRVVVSTGAPAGATAALVNLTITGAQADGYVTAEPCGAAPGGVRTSSNGNAAPGQTVANLAIVPIDSAGKFCLYRSQPMHTIVDVQGFFSPAKSAGPTATLFNAVAPARLVDTRTTSPLAQGGVLAVPATGVPAGAVAALANLTVTEPGGAGYLTADSCTALAPGPQTHSNANFAAAATVANLSVVPLTNGQFCAYSTAQTHVVVDLQGAFVPASSPGWGFTALPAQRLVDTR